jgi:primosomal protein N' (replication factor Y)
VQAYAPEHFAITLAATHDYDAFASKELEIRRELRYPPFGRIAYVILSGVDRAAVNDTATTIAAHVRESARDVEILGPAPDMLPKARGEHRVRIVFKSVSEDAMLKASELVQRRRKQADARTTIIIDPR